MSTTSLNVGSNNAIWINGKRIDTVGSESISVIGDQIYVDGKIYDQSKFKNSKEQKVFICVVGNVEKIAQTNGANIFVKGDVNNYIENDSGNITIGGDVIGDINTDTGNVYVGGNVAGDTHANVGNVYVSKQSSSIQKQKQEIEKKSSTADFIAIRSGYDQCSETHSSRKTDRDVEYICNRLVRMGNNDMNEIKNLVLKCRINDGVRMIHRLWKNFIDWLMEDEKRNN
jgi:hypothetical protein